MTAIVPEMDATRPAQVDPTKIIEAIEDFGVTNLFGSPALIRRVGEYGAAQRDQAADAPAGDLGRGAGAGAGARDVRDDARAGRADLHALRGDRGAPGRLDRQRRDPRRDPPRDRPRAPGSASAGRSRGCGSRSSGSPTSRSPTWSDDLLVPDGEIGEIVVQGPVVTRVVLRPARGDRAGQDRRPGRRRVLAPDGRPRLPRRRRAGSGSAGGSRTGSSTAEGTLYTIPCEAVFNTHPEVARTALVGVGPAGTDAAGALRRAGGLAAVAGATGRGSAASLLDLGATHPHTRAIRDVPLPPVVPGRHPPQRQDLPREAGRLGGEEAADEGAGDRRRRVPRRGDRPPAGRAGRRGPEPGAGRLPGAARPRRRDGPGRPGRPRGVSAAAVEGCDVVFHVAAKAGIWGPYRGVSPEQRRGDAERRSRPAGRAGCGGWSSPARRASSSTAATWRASTSRSPTRSTTTPPTRRPRPRPSGWSWRPTARAWRPSRSGRT